MIYYALSSRQRTLGTAENGITTRFYDQVRAGKGRPGGRGLKAPSISVLEN